MRLVDSFHLKPVDRPVAARFGKERAMRLKSSLPDAPDEAERQRPERHIEQPSAFRSDDVVFALGNRVRDDLDLPLVDPIRS